MEIETNKVGDKSVMKFKGEMNIYFAVDLKNALLNAIDEYEEIEVDMSDVSEIDTTAFQLLMSLNHLMIRKEKKLVYSKASQEVEQAISLCGLGLALGYPGQLSDP